MDDDVLSVHAHKKIIKKLMVTAVVCEHKVYQIKKCFLLFTCPLRAKPLLI